MACQLYGFLFLFFVIFFLFSFKNVSGVGVQQMLNSKSQAMLKSKIKTHAIGRQYVQPHFFILSKGRNAGKPMPECCANCYVFLADDQDDRDFHFYVFLGLWELKYFRPYLVGSVIEFIRIGDLIDIAEETINAVNACERSFMDVAGMLAQIEAGRARLQAQVAYLMQLRRALFNSYLRR
jgi:hypothetical protein